jgi:hypothetical protein
MKKQIAAPATVKTISLGHGGPPSGTNVRSGDPAGAGDVSACRPGGVSASASRSIGWPLGRFDGVDFDASWTTWSKMLGSCGGDPVGVGADSGGAVTKTMTKTTQAILPSAPSRMLSLRKSSCELATCLGDEASPEAGGVPFGGLAEEPRLGRRFARPRTTNACSSFGIDSFGTT